LKDVYLLHKWDKIQANIKTIDWANEIEEKSYTDINTLGAVACSGGVCELVF
jgi:ribonucleoside-diphosphate reductase alpha chain